MTTYSSVPGVTASAAVREKKPPAAGQTAEGDFLFALGGRRGRCRAEAALGRSAEAALSPTGLRQRGRALGVYRRNAERMLDFFSRRSVPCTGGENAPYLWVRCPDGGDSWGWFRRLLEECGVICAPGAGFGAMGEGWLRFTAFGKNAATAEALRRMARLF